MAGGAPTLSRSSNDIPYLATAIAIKREWVVEFSRFFNYPRICSFFSSSSSSLKSLPKCKTRSCGTWISSSSLASLHLQSPSAIISVSVCGKILEEHFVSNLHFSWPQVSCAADCPTRGSRVVFASFRDSGAQIQKFALRFSASCDAQSFLDAVKESVKDIFDTRLARSDFVFENVSQPEYIASNALHHRTDEEPSFANTNASDHSEMPLLRVSSEELQCSQQLLPSNNPETVFSALPPSFTELLTGCLTENVNAEPPKVPEEADLISQITGCVSDSSFHEFLTRVEKVIHALGGDMTI